MKYVSLLLCLNPSLRGAVTSAVDGAMLTGSFIHELSALGSLGKGDVAPGGSLTEFSISSAISHSFAKEAT